MPKREMAEQVKVEYLKRAGFEEWEAFVLAHEAKYKTLYKDARGYESRKDDPGIYLQRMIQSRRHNVRRWTKAGLSPDEIHQRILKAYRGHGWFSRPKGLKDAAALHLDPMRMLAWFRQRAIESGDYIPRPRSRPGSHHALTPGGEEKKRKRLQELYGARPSQVRDKRDASLKIEDLNQQITRAIGKGDQKERRRLELRRDQWQRRYDFLTGR